MKIIDIFRIALTNFKFNKLRTFLTVCGISVGIGSIVFLVSLGYGLQRLTTQKIAGIEAINTLNVSPGKSSAVKLDKAMVQKFQEDQKVEKICPVLNLPAQVIYEDSKADISLNAVESSFFGLEGLKPFAGDFFTNDENQAVVSTGLVKTLNVQSAALISQDLGFDIFIADPNNSSKLSKSNKVYKVVGIIEDDTSAFAYVPLATVADLGSDNYNLVKIKVKNRDDLAAVRKEIEDEGFTVTSIAETISQVNNIFRYIQLGLGLLGIIALLVASIGMFNTMTIALLERIRDIGVMKAVGTTDSDVRKIFLAESVSIGLAGGVGGIILGLLTSQIVNLLINMLAKSVGGEPATLFYTPPTFALEVAIFALVVGLLTGFYPARRAAKINPLEALRYE
jgi:putative ABC transport system permease protein